MERFSLAAAECYLKWRSMDAAHTDRHFFPALDLERDILPGNLAQRMLNSQAGTVSEVSLAPGEIIPETAASAVHTVTKPELTAAFRSRRIPGPFAGRYYPRGLLAECDGLGTIRRQEQQPFRVVGIDESRVEVDLNPPLAGYTLTVGGAVTQHLESRGERGAKNNDVVVHMARQGAGMQCRPFSGTVDYVHRHAFSRLDSADDASFYRNPRMVHHLDAQARWFVDAIYTRFASPQARVLDLMSSWVSHLDGIPDSARVFGLGMNAAELRANRRLTDFRVHDLNMSPTLPFPDASFDLAVCTVSVEYLVRPFETFSEVGRVLRSGGRFVVTFSDRWFPPKVVRIWQELHPVERMGLVLEYFRQTGRFSELATESFSGWPRPLDDKYYPQRGRSDPVYAVWGIRTTAA